MQLASGVPTITELFDFQPFQDNPLGISWTVLSMFIAFSLATLFMLTAFRQQAVVPGKLQLMGEGIVGFVRKNIADEVIGHDGVRYMPYLVTMFVLILFFNMMEVIPGIAFPATSKIAVPAFFAGVSYIVFNFEGLRANGPLKYFGGILFPPGVPKLAYILLTPIEFLSILVIRPVTLTLRLTFNMLAGHLILSLLAVLAATVSSPLGPKVLALPLVIAMGAVLTAFELFVGFLQAFIFTVLTALYIGGAIHPEH